MARALAGFAQWVASNTVQYAAAGFGLCVLLGGVGAVWWSNTVHSRPPASCGTPGAVQHYENAPGDCVLAPSLPLYGAVRSTTETGLVVGGAAGVLLLVVGVWLWVYAARRRP